MAGEATIATAYVQLVPSLAGVQGAIGEAFGGAEAEKAASQAGQRAGGALLDGLKKIAGPAAIAGVAAGLFAIGSTFDDVSDSIRTATGKTGTDLDTMVQQAKTIGTTVPVEFDKIGPALSKVSQRLGLTGDDLTGVTSQFLAAGNVLGQDVNIDKATASLTAFGVKGKDVSGALDDVFKVSQSTGTSFDDITSAVQQSAPALQQLGFNFQQSASLVGQLDKAGLNSTTTLAAMSKGMVKLAKDGKDPQQAFTEITTQIGDLVSQGKDAEAINLASGIFGTKGASQFVQATKDGALNVGDLTKAVAGSSETILGAQSDTADFAESWTLFKNKAMVAIEPVATAVFNFAGQAMQALLDAFDNIGTAVDNVTTFFSDYKDVIIALGVVVLALTSNLILQTAATVAQQVATVAVSVATKAWGVAQAALNLIMDANPIMLVVAAIAAITAAVIWAYQNVGWFRDLVDNTWTVISNAAQWAWNNIIKPVFDALAAAVAAIIDWFANFGTNVSAILSNLGGWIADAWQKIVDFFVALPGNVWDIIVAAATQITTFGSNFIGWVKDGIVAGAEAIWTWFTELPSNIWNAIKDLASKLGEYGGKIVGWIVDGIKGAAQSVLDAIGGLFSDITFNADGTLSAPGGYVTANPFQTGAGGGVLPGYAPGVDNVPALLSPGEGVLVPEAVRAVGPEWVYRMNRWARGARGVGPGNMLGVEHFAGGGIAGTMTDIGSGIGDYMAGMVKTGGHGWFADMMDALFGSLTKKAVTSRGGGGFFGGTPAGYNASAGVEQWRGLALQALAMTGESPANVGALLYQMQTESGGNPTIVNDWDINAQRGTPSVGLMQVIYPTFVSALSGTPFAGLIGAGLTDPLANIVSSILYARNRYGSLANAYRGVAYDNGGWLYPGDQPVNNLRKPEPILAPHQWEIAQAAIDTVNQGAAGSGMTFNVYQQPGQSPAELAREMDRMIRFHSAVIA